MTTRRQRREGLKSLAMRCSPYGTKRALTRDSPSHAGNDVAWGFAVLGLAVLASLLVVPIARSAETADASTAQEIQWQPYTGTAVGGRPIEGELGRLRVPENRRRPTGSTIELAFVRYRTSHPNPGPPIFFLIGGPGGSGVEFAALVATHPQIRLLEHSDVIGVDQRGTGLTVPNLMEPETEVYLPLDHSFDRTEYIVALDDAVRRMVAHWRDQGVDLSAYNSIESADDVDAVRRALGLEKIILYGSSYGSHLALAYLRQHSEHVDRAVLSKVEGPDHSWKLPSTVQRSLEHLHHQAADDPAVATELPDLQGTIRRLLRQLSESPVTVAADGDKPAVTLGPHDLQIELSRALASSNTVASIPGSLLRLEQGDWSELADAVHENRQLGIPAMTLMMDCASAASAARQLRIESETRDPNNLLADAIMAPFYPEACHRVHNATLDDTFRGRLDSNVPVLFTSGTLDVRTPPENVEEILVGMPNAVHVIVENAGHESRELMSPEYRDLLQAFLRGEKIESCRITLPEPIFELLSEQ